MKKFFVLVLCIMFILIPTGTNALASEIENFDSIENQGQIRITMMRADIIEYRYREYNGRIQYRRWNTTKKCWVDAYWIYV